jgi:SAM-dependent methyltransferase
LGTPPAGLRFEKVSPLRRVLRRVLVNPFANYTPRGLMRGLLRFSKSRLAAANWKDPGGWESMVISYDNRPTQISDKLLVGGGAMAAALRNRKMLGAFLLAQLIDQTKESPVNVLCLGAGPGAIITEALGLAKTRAKAVLVDISSAAFDYGRELAAQRGLADRVEFIQADVRDLKKYLHAPPHVVKMLGICEYLSDEMIVMIASAASAMMPPGAAIVFNCISTAHGTDRFFRRVLGLNMNHRSPEGLCELMAQAGFDNFTAYPEPQGVFQVIVGRKRN